MNFSYDGYLKNIITMEAKDVLAGDIVALDIDGIAVKAKKNDKIVGVATTDSDKQGYCGVQTTGYIELDFEGVIKPGFNKILVGAEGSVALGEGGKEHLVLKVTAEKTIGLIL